MYYKKHVTFIIEKAFKIISVELKNKKQTNKKKTTQWNHCMMTKAWRKARKFPP